MSEPASEFEYVGFWLRVVAAIIDSILMTMLLVPLLGFLVGPGVFTGGAEASLTSMLLQIALPAIAVIAFWRYKSATPGKMVVGAEIVDAETLEPPSTGQLIGRYFGYYVSIIPFMLGLLWVAFDPRKQGFHDKLAGTVVIRRRRNQG